MVTGGWLVGDNTASVELLNLDGSWHCSLPPLPEQRDSHTQTGLVACGGFQKNSQKSCVRFSKGEEKWKKSHTLKKKRWSHVSWNSPEGILLMGGLGSGATYELLTNNGHKPAPGFKFKYIHMTG